MKGWSILSSIAVVALGLGVSVLLIGNETICDDCLKDCVGSARYTQVFCEDACRYDRTSASRVDFDCVSQCLDSNHGTLSFCNAACQRQGPSNMVFTGR